MKRWAEATRSYREALALASNEPERHFLRRRLTEVGSSGTRRDLPESGRGTA